MDRSRAIFALTATVVASASLFLAGLYAGAAQGPVLAAVRTALDHVRTSLDLTTTTLQTVVAPETPFLQPARGHGAGVVTDLAPDRDALILMAGFFDGGNEIRLIDRTGEPVARWPVRHSAYFPDTGFLPAPPFDDFHIDTHGALIRPDGSLVFNFEYGGTVKLDRCGETRWALRHPTHHSVELAESGGYWIVGRTTHRRDDPDEFAPWTRSLDPGHHYHEDLILRVSEDGEILEQLSIPQIMLDSGMEALLTATGRGFMAGDNVDDELVHVNKIGELSAEMAPAFPGLEAGDLLLSERTYNLIFVVDPDSRRVVWHQVGPWLRQHDPEFNPDGTITLFNNNVYANHHGPEGRSHPDTPRVSNIMALDPYNRETRIVFGGRPGQEMLSHIRGKHERTPQGGYVITEFEAGRVLEIDRDGQIVWEFVNAFDQDFVAEVTEARVYPSSYFTVSDWSCP